MILCVCLSPALDITYEVASLGVGATNRVRQVTRHAGGKAVNVARVLHGLDEPVRLLAPVGTGDGPEFVGALAGSGLTLDAVPSGVPMRRTVTVVDESTREATVLAEPAHLDCWPAVVERYEALLPAVDVVVISGSAPDGVPAGGLAGLTRSARELGRPVIVDTSGPALADVLGARPTVIKPNAAELAELTGHDDVLVAARSVAHEHGVTVVASRGVDGLIAVDSGAAWHARPSRPLAGNPTGAGDALVAGLARGWTSEHDVAELLADCVALSAAAVLHPYAGHVDASEVAAQRAGVQVARLTREDTR